MVVVGSVAPLAIIQCNTGAFTALFVGLCWLVVLLPCVVAGCGFAVRSLYIATGAGAAAGEAAPF